MIKKTSRNDANRQNAKKNEREKNNATFKMVLVMGRWVLKGSNGTIIEGRKKSLIKLCSSLNAMAIKKPRPKNYRQKWQEEDYAF